MLRRIRFGRWAAAGLAVGLMGAAGAAEQDARRRGGDREAALLALEQRLAHAELLAGLTPVHGPGVQVVLRDSPRSTRRRADAKDLQIQDQDVNGILNALRAAGAEAIAVGGAAEPLERVLANSAARGMGGTLLLNGARLTAPYRILAIGDSKRLRAELFREDGVVKKAGLSALEMIQVDDAPRLEIPAARSPGSFQHARSAAPVVEPAARPVLRPVGVATSLPKPAAPTAVSLAAPPVAPEQRTPYFTRPAAPSSVGEPVLFGGRTLAKFHVAGCRFGERIPAAERVLYGSLQEAGKGQRLPCAVCQPQRAGRVEARSH